MKRLPFFALLVGLAGTSAFGAPLCTSFEGMTAAGFQNLGSTGCQFGDKIFSNFSYTYTVYDDLGNVIAGGDAGTPNVPASSVGVVFSDLGGNPFMPVLSFLGNWTASGGHPADISIFYDVTSALNHPIYGGWVGLTGSVDYSGSGVKPFISAGDTVDAGGPQANYGTNIRASGTGITSGTFTGSGLLLPAATSIAVQKDVYLYPGSVDSGSAVALTRIDQGLYEVSPEPMVSLMVGGGFTLLGLLGARNRKKKNS